MNEYININIEINGFSLANLTTLEIFTIVKESAPDEA
jgi:hypothetical protein